MNWKYMNWKYIIGLVILIIGVIWYYRKKEGFQDAGPTSTTVADPTSTAADVTSTTAGPTSTAADPTSTAAADVTSTTAGPTSTAAETTSTTAAETTSTTAAETTSTTVGPTSTTAAETTSTTVGPTSTTAETISTTVADVISTTVGPTSTTVGPTSTTVGPTSTTVGPTATTTGPTATTAGPTATTIGSTAAGLRTATSTTTTKPIVISEQPKIINSRPGNLISINNTIALNSPVNLNVETGNSELPYKTELQLLDTYVLTQLWFKDLTNSGSIKIRIGVRNTVKNDLQFVNFADLLVRGNEVVDSDSVTYLQKTTGNTQTSNLYISNPTNIYGTQLLGDRIIIYTASKILTNCKMYCFGFLEKDNYKESTLKMAKNLNNDIYVGGYDNITKQQSAGMNDYLISSFQIINKLPIPVGCVPQLFKVVFKNNYTNDIVTYPGPVNGYFIYDPSLETQTIILTTTMVATKFSICSAACGGDPNVTDITQCVAVQNIKGYTASIADINRFKLEYNITDIRGSINPDNVCPSIDKFVENQLSSELIIDAMDYQKKINDEKTKLQSNKDNLLHLLEQQDEIKQLGKLVGKINDIRSNREHQTNAINAMQLFKQMNEYTKLKEVLDDRVALRKKNTFNMDVNVNKTDTKEPFVNMNRNAYNTNKHNTNTYNPTNFNLSPEDNYRLI